MTGMRHCAYCGDEMGCYDDYHRDDTCGRQECERWAREELQAEREDAHEELDRDMGWY